MVRIATLLLPSAATESRGVPDDEAAATEDGSEPLNLPPPMFSKIDSPRDYACARIAPFRTVSCVRELLLGGTQVQTKPKC